ncbi:MAG: hypothetical protein ABSE00_06420 [Chitinispirillaceae bacterium]|jgi:formylglycine-generating enzyme required for sulfatase activity
MHGGSWYDVADYLRSAHRFSYTSPRFRRDYYGFRCLRRSLSDPTDRVR